MRGPVLSLCDVTIRYGPAVAVDALTLDVLPGEIFGLLGPNGSGKSSTLAAIIGDRPFSGGDIRVDELREKDSPLDYRRRIGFVPQELAFFEDLTAVENMEFFGKLYGLRGQTLRQRVADNLEFVNLGQRAGQLARNFSGGMQRRLNLACSLLHDPVLLLLDEPTVGLDIQSRDAIFSVLRQLRDRGTAIVFTTHHMEEAEQLCSRIGIMNKGKLVALGTLDELVERQGMEEQRKLLAENGQRKVRFDPPHAARGPHPQLERIYLELTGRSPGA